MKLKSIFYTFILMLFAVSLMSFTYLKFEDNSFKKNSNKNNPSEQIAMVYPNPESGVLNLYCSKNLQSPLKVKIINTKGELVKTIPTVIANTTENHQYLQIVTADMNKGAYSIVIFDANGQTFNRKIYLQK